MNEMIKGFYLLNENNEITKSLELFDNGNYKLGKNSFENREEKIKYIDEVVKNSFKK